MLLKVLTGSGEAAGLGLAEKTQCKTVRTTANNPQN